MTDAEKQKYRKIVIDKIETNRAVKQTLEPDWNFNLSFYMGEQWVRYTQSLGTLNTFNTQYKKYTFNVIKPLVSVLTAKLTKAIPVLQVQPNTPASNDLNAARVGQYVAMSEIWEGNDMGVRNLSIMPILCSCGNDWHDKDNKASYAESNK